MIKYYLTLLFFFQLFSHDSSYAFTQSNTQGITKGTAEGISQNKVKRGQLVRRSDLLKNAEQHSEVIAVLEAKDSITIKSRLRAWYYISPENLPDNPSNKLTNKKLGQKTLYGWVNMLNVRFVMQAKREGELGLSAAFSSMTKGTLPTVSTGVRGFDDDDLKKAQTDFKQIECLHAYAVSKKSAKLFAQSGHLLSQNVNQEQKK